MSVTLYQGDCLDVLRSIEPGAADVMITDPPAGIGFMGKEWDKSRGGRDAWIAWLAERLGEAYRILPAGAVSLVWALPKTSHWTALACEDAGFQVLDVVHHLFGSGFPKNKQHLKPAAEHWLLIQKPGGPRVLNIDECRIPSAGSDPNARTNKAAARTDSRGYDGGWNQMDRAWEASTGRWPPHVLLSHSPECQRVGTKRVKNGGGATYTHSKNENGYDGGWGDLPPQQYHRGTDGFEAIEDWECAPDCPVRVVGEQSGVSTSSDHQRHVKARDHVFFGQVDTRDRITTGKTDTGTAARFFPNLPADDTPLMLYQAKASRRERNAGCEGLGAKPIAEREGRNPIVNSQYRIENGVITGKKARSETAQNHHPTVKSTALMRWLVRLITPAGGVVLDPFMGSGSTGVAAIAEGRWFIGIEQSDEYMPIAEARIAHAKAQAYQEAFACTS